MLLGSGLLLPSRRSSIDALTQGIYEDIGGYDSLLPRNAGCAPGHQSKVDLIFLAIKFTVEQ